ncbi:hypothetical protein EPN29_00925 [bacterium]|nr:MAG: hypothetical protein EPN29_00925 [bacterium]
MVDVPAPLVVVGLSNFGYTVAVHVHDWVVPVTTTSKVTGWPGAVTSTFVFWLSIRHDSETGAGTGDGPGVGFGDGEGDGVDDGAGDVPGRGDGVERGVAAGAGDGAGTPTLLGEGDRLGDDDGVATVGDGETATVAARA